MHNNQHVFYTARKRSVELQFRRGKCRWRVSTTSGRRRQQRQRRQRNDEITAMCAAWRAKWQTYSLTLLSVVPATACSIFTITNAGLSFLDYSRYTTGHWNTGSRRLGCTVRKKVNGCGDGPRQFDMMKNILIMTTEIAVYVAGSPLLCHLSEFATDLVSSGFILAAPNVSKPRWLPTDAKLATVFVLVWV